MTNRFKLGPTHFIIPDTQCKPGQDNEQLAWIGDYVADKQPDVVVHLGDHWDMPSLSSYDRGKLKFEGRRYKHDIKAGNDAMRAFWEPIDAMNEQRRINKKKMYRPRYVFLMGNHEERIARAIESNFKEFAGEGKDPYRGGMIGYHHLYLDGWEVHNFLEPIEIDGVHYAHYFYNPMSGHPWGGQASTMLKNIGFSFTQGHRQGKQSAERHLADGTVHRGLVVGSCYLHDEDYKGPQGNHHWRGCIQKHEVRAGNYDMMEISLNFLRERYRIKRAYYY